MSGYVDFSKSVNAFDAEDDGRFPLTRAAREAGVPAELVKQFVSTEEWHHVSKFYNRVDYYSVAAIQAVFGRPVTGRHDSVLDLPDPDPAAVAALAAWKPAKAAAIVHENCIVEWVEWVGRFRNHRRAVERRVEGCTVTVKGKTATVVLPGGGTLTKRLDTPSFSFRAVRQEA